MAPPIEQLWERAEANNFQINAHEERGSERGQGKHVPKTIRNQDGTLRRYCFGVMRKVHLLDLRSSPPTADMVSAEYLRPGAPASTLKFVKDFVRFYIPTSRPVLGEKPTADALNSTAE